MGTIVDTSKVSISSLFSALISILKTFEKYQHVVSTPRCNKDCSCRQNSITTESYKYEPWFLLLWETTAYIKSPSHDRIHYVDVCLYIWTYGWTGVYGTIMERC